VKKLNQLIISAAVLACAAGNAMAQSTNFIGPAVGLTVSAQSYKLDRDPAWTSDMTGNAVGAELVGSWGFDVAPKWVVTVGATISLKNSEFYSDSVNGTNSTATSKQRYSLYVAPGLRLGTDGLLYGKVGYHSMVVNYASTAGTDIDKTHQGYGLGFGYAHALTKNLELRGEFETLAYSSENTAATTKIAPKQNNLNLSLLYKF
jgi:opacity protein-like surface antigen